MTPTSAAPPHVHDAGPHRAPRDCPVCADHLATTRLGCTSCGTEVSGLFASCSYCGLSGADQDMLRVFLVSRGNMRELERFLGVSYPTARQRFAELLERLGLAEPTTPSPDAAAEPQAEVQPQADIQPQAEPAAAPDDAAQVLRRLASGELEVDEAETLLRTSAP